MKKLLFIEEAIRIQSEFYKKKEEKDIKLVAEKFYMEQVFFMLYQLRYDYVQDDDTKKIKKYMLKKQNAVTTGTILW